jgi:DNA-binding IclR family transcriptional regulator
VEQDPVTQAYRLGPEAVTLGLVALDRMDLRTAARPVLERLVKATGETCMLGVISGDHAVYIDQVPSPHEVRMNITVGVSRPFNCTAVGKVLLAYRDDDEMVRLYGAGAFREATARSIRDVDTMRHELERIRREGVALDVEEYLVGARCVAAPIRDFEGRVVAAVAASGPAERMKAGEEHVVTEVRKAAADISAALGASARAQEEVLA